MERSPELVVRPLTRENWADFETLFGERGACGGCWCMWFRLAKKDFERQKGAANKAAMRALVERGVVPGLIGSVGEAPVAWLSVAPREEFPRLARSRVAARIDDEPVWSVVCFFVDKAWRGRGLAVRLLDAAARWVGEQGGRLVEGYAVEPKKRMPAAFAYQGPAELFRAAGFEEVARPTPTRPRMRRRVGG